LPNLRQKDLLNILKKRIAAGAYRFSGLPAERELADEIGVARMTARKGLQRLVDEGIATRLSTGRLAFSRALPQKKQVMILIPDIASKGIKNWVDQCQEASKDLNIHLTPVYYDDYSDITLTETLQKAEGTFFIPRAEEVPHWTIRNLTRHPKVICLETDLSADGLPSIDLFKPSSLYQLLQHLLDLGHQKIDCFNNQGHSQTIQQRINYWSQWLNDNHLKGKLLDVFDPEHPSLDLEMSKIKSFLSKEQPKAIVCTSLNIATQTLRACRDLDINIGTDLHLVLMDGEGQSNLLTPSITALERPDCTRYLRKCFQWILKEDEPWSGERSLNILDVQLVVGETTVS
jgi:DNA-binding LacI/PurR family transcriptional regulator